MGGVGRSAAGKRQPTNKTHLWTQQRLMGEATKKEEPRLSQTIELGCRDEGKGDPFFPGPPDGSCVRLSSHQECFRAQGHKTHQAKPAPSRWAGDSKSSLGDWALWGASGRFSWLQEWDSLTPAAVDTGSGWGKCLTAGR